MNELGHRKSVYAIGECMVELSHSEGDDYRRSFAGDVYNTAVYLKRLAPADCSVEFVSAVGDDIMSNAMLEAWRQEEISTTHVAALPGKSPGLYFIHTDEDGERNFSYWRSRAAARELTIALERLDAGAFRKGDYIYYSGITLAILNEDRRAQLLDLIRTAKSAGALIAFDPNFRPALWESHGAATTSIRKAYESADVVLTGAEEGANLFGWAREQDHLAALERFGVNEAIVKAGERGVFGASNGERFHIPFTRAQKVVDTTAAGDSFAGAYLAFRLRGKMPEEATSLAAKVARVVISSNGAILDRHWFATQVNEDAMLARAIQHVN